MKAVNTSNLIPGMTTAKDIYTYDDQLIIPKDTILTDNIITRLEFYSISNIYITEYSNSGFENPNPLNSYSKKIQSSEEFQQFQKDFLENAENLKQSLTDIIDKKVDIDPASMLLAAKSLLPERNTSIHLFDMLHNMRQYDDATYIHSMNVALICNIFGHWLNMDQNSNDLLTLCGLLHDIGKIMIPDKLLLKSAKLTESEFTVLKTHTLRGYKILQDLDLDPHVKYSALMHHERCDGTGYPRYLNGSRIDEYAKIVAIADVYDAMTSARVYRGPLCPFEVIHIFESEGLQKYDPKYILIFLEQIVNTYMNNSVHLSNGMEGEIVLINKLSLSKPVVKVNNEYIDLSKQHTITIESII